jgi:hypothetical protein
MLRDERLKGEIARVHARELRRLRRAQGLEQLNREGIEVARCRVGATTDA